MEGPRNDIEAVQVIFFDAFKELAGVLPAEVDWLIESTPTTREMRRKWEVHAPNFAPIYINILPYGVEIGFLLPGLSEPWAEYYLWDLLHDATPLQKELKEVLCNPISAKVSYRRFSVRLDLSIERGSKSECRPSTSIESEFRVFKGKHIVELHYDAVLPKVGDDCIAQ